MWWRSGRCDLEAVRKSLIGAGAHKIFVSDHPIFREAVSDTLADEVVAILDEHDVDAILFACTPLGRELSALIAIERDTCVAPDCTKVEITGDAFRVERPVYAGKAIQSVEITHRPVVISYRPNYGSPIEGAVAPAEFVEISAAGIRESHVHDVQIVKEAPNYHVD